MWRPNNWEELKKQPQRPDRFEAGADAILSALGMEGMKLGESQRFVDWYRENKDSENLPWLEIY